MTWVFEGTVLPSGRQGQVMIEPDGGSLGTSPPSPVERLPGAFSVTGLVDGHCHLTLAREQGPPYVDLDGTPARLRQLAQSGVTLVRDVGGERSVTLELARTVSRGQPQVLAAGRFLAPANRYFPGLFSPVEPDALVEAVAAEVRDGATWVKIVADFPRVEDGRVTAPAAASYAVEVVTAAVAAAHALGARVAAHTTTDAVSGLIRAGVDSVEHGDALTAEDLEALGARGGAWTPTLSSSFPGRTTVRDDERDYAERMSALLPVALRAGVTVLAGSDITGTVPAEIDWLHRLGLTVGEALDAAGPRAETYFGASSRDSVVTYRTDPRSDPSVLAHPAAVVIRGVRVR
jgi:imidazolonepropionase-like amidohydrolase